MQTSIQGRKFIESFEGLILKAYDDFNDHIVRQGEAVRGTLTIGYGHTSAAGNPHVFIGQTITRSQADAILASDLSKVEKEVAALIKVPLNQNQFDALVSFHFNTGALGKSTLLKVLNGGNYQTAANEFLKWTHSGGRELAGLVRRRQAERKLFLTPTTQGKTIMNPILNIMAMLLGPTQVGGWVRAAVASGLTYAATKYGVSFLSDPGLVSEIGAIASTVVVGLWSSLSKTGTVYLPDVIKTIQSNTIPQTSIDHQSGTAG